MLTHWQSLKLAKEWLGIRTIVRLPANVWTRRGQKMVNVLHWSSVVAAVFGFNCVIVNCQLLIESDAKWRQGWSNWQHPASNHNRVNNLVWLPFGTCNRAQYDHFWLIRIIIIIIPRQCLWCCHHGRAIAKVHLLHLMFDKCRKAPCSRRPKTKPYDLACEFAYTDCQSLHLPSLFIIITQPESWYPFYHPMEGRRLSRASWLVTYCTEMVYPSTDGHPSWY